ncbi:MAG: hypothetical protein SFZ24_10365 [Planctomycetota bacterium]|nr:hypothetical protein [Planctomycetota bacterium]
MPSSTTSAITERGRQRRGVVITEAMLVMMILALLLFIAPAMWQYWMWEHRTRAEAHRSTFAKTSTFLDLSAWDAWWSDAPDVDAPELPPFPNAFPAGLDGFGDFPQTAVVGEAESAYRVDSPYNILERQGTFRRYGTVLRPSWTWQGFPFVHTQDMLERGEITGWYDDGLGETLDDDVKEALGLGD